MEDCNANGIINLGPVWRFRHPGRHRHPQTLHRRITLTSSQQQQPLKARWMDGVMQQHGRKKENPKEPMFGANVAKVTHLPCKV